MAEDTAQEKTEQPTAKRLSKARDEGKVAKSREVNSAVLLGGALLFFGLYGGPWMRGLIGTFRRGLNLYAFMEEGKGVHNLYAYWAGEILALVAPIFLLFFLLSIVASVSQIGFLLAPKQLAPKLEKLNPLQGVKKFVSLDKSKFEPVPVSPKVRPIPPLELWGRGVPWPGFTSLQMSASSEPKFSGS